MSGYGGSTKCMLCGYDAVELKAEIERLRVKLDAVSTEEWDRIIRERDEAREAARNICIVETQDNPAYREWYFQRWPWLEEE